MQNPNRDLSGKPLITKTEEESEKEEERKEPAFVDDALAKEKSIIQPELFSSLISQEESQVKLQILKKSYDEFQKKSQKFNKKFFPFAATLKPKLICTKGFLEGNEEEESKDEYLIRKSFSLLSETVQNISRDFFFCKNPSLQKFNSVELLDRRMKSIRKIWICFYYGNGFPLSYFNDLEQSDFQNLRDHLNVIYNQVIKIDTKENIRNGMVEIANNVSRLKEMDKYTKSLNRFFKYLQREMIKNEKEDPRMAMYNEYLEEGFSLEQFMNDFVVAKETKDNKGQVVKLVVPRKISKDFLKRVAKCKKLVERMENYKKYVFEDEIINVLKEQNVKYMRMFLNTPVERDPNAWTKESIANYVNKKYKIKWTLPEFKHSFQRTLIGISICQSEV